jgi:cation transport ATPase
VLIHSPVTALLLFPPPALGSYSADREAAKYAAQGIGRFSALPKGDPVDLTLSQFSSRAVYDSAKTLKGRTVRMIGFVTKDVDGTWYLTRLLISCCAATLTGELEDGGRTAVLVTVDGAPVGVLGIADRLRPDAAATVSSLTSLTGAVPLLLTGDNPRAAARLAAEVGIKDVRAGLLPQDKVDAVRELESAGRRVLVVGDGVNDAPALAAAHTGVAMGRAGSDLALETVDAVTVRDELATVPAVIALSRRARRLVVLNLAIAGVFIAALVVWDLAGHLPLPLGVAGHEGSTVIVGLNGLRLLREAVWKRGAL